MPTILTPGATAGVLLELDPASEGTGTPLILADGLETFLLQWDFPEPDEDPLNVETRDMEGARPVHNRHKARTGTIVLRALGTGATPHEACDAIVSTIEHKVQKIRAEGGTLQATVPSGKVAVLDLHAGSQAVTLDKRWVDHARCQITLTFGARPYWRGEPVILADRTETSTGVLVFTEAGIAGSVPGDVTIVIDDDEGEAQRLVILGIQSRHYSADATAALHYECEGRTPLGGTVTATGAAGASGGGSNVLRQTNLFTSPQAIMSSQASGGGDHLAHVGGFRWWQRLYVPNTGSGTIFVRLEWGEGDFRQTTENATVEIPDSLRSTWLLVDMGTVNLNEVAQGSQRWEARVMAWSTVIGDDIDLDRFFLAPFDEGYCEVRAGDIDRPGVLTARDEFTGRTAGVALNGTSAPVGGTWASAGSATDFAASDSPAPAETISRSTTADAGTPRIAALGSTDYTNTEVSSDFRGTAGIQAGVIARWADSSNYLLLVLENLAGSDDIWLILYSVIGGSVTSLGEAFIGDGTADEWRRVRLIAYASGRVVALCEDVATGVRLARIETTNGALATGGALEDGKPGIWDAGFVGAGTRYVDNFYAATPAAESLAIAPGRSVEIGSDGAIRQDASAATWIPVPLEGFYPRVPPAWLEGRTTRFLVATCRGPQLAASVYADPELSDLSARVTYTPRFLNLPES